MAESRTRASLEADLRSAWVAELERWWTTYNEDYCAGSLRRPHILLGDGMATLGTWDGQRRTLTIAESHVRHASWHDVLATLRHEMAHQFADEVLGGRGETPHGEAFRLACDRLRADRRARVRPAAKALPDDGRDRTLRIAEKLLALAGSPNQHEAKAAFAMARRLLLEHDLHNPPAHAAFAIRELGRLKGRHQAWEFVLGSLLEEFFFVRVIWVHGFDARTLARGTLLQAYGTQAHLDLAEYVHDYLTRLLGELWTSYRNERGLSGDRERARFYEGVVRGFADKLREQDRALRDERGLVPLADPELSAFYRHHNPRIRRSSAGGGRVSEAYADGERKGRDVTVHRPLGSGQSARSQALLGPG
jgi:hypothetical protein